MKFTTYDFVIVGSGPAALCAGNPIVRDGKHTLFIEAGKKLEQFSDTIEPSQQINLNNYQSKFGSDSEFFKSFQHWSPKFRMPNVYKASKIAIENIDSEYNNFYLANSYMTGGFSNIWGGAISFPDPSQLGIICKKTQNEINECYKIISKTICRPCRSSEFQIKKDINCPFINFYGNSLSTNSEKINFCETQFGVNIRNSSKSFQNEDLFNSRIALQKLIQGTNSKLLENTIVIKFTELDNGFVEIEVKEKDGTIKKVYSKRLILAAGALNSAIIVCNSLNKTIKTRLLNSPMSYGIVSFPFNKLNRSFMAMPTTSFWSNGKAQIFGNLTPMSSFKIYEYLARTSLPFKLVEFILNLIINRSYVFNLYFSSDYSDNTLELKPNNKIKITGKTTKDYQIQLNKRKRLFFMRYCLPLGGVELPFSFRKTVPGTDIHYGGTIPMRSKPGEMETDWHGKLFGFKKVYCVDGATLPKIPAMPHTLLIMANAYRISRKLLFSS